MDKLVIIFFLISIAIGVFGSLKFSSGKILGEYRFMYREDWKNMSNPEDALQGYCAEIAKYQYLRGFAWGVMLCAFIIFLDL